MSDKKTKDTLYTVTGKVTETSEVMKGEKAEYTKSVVETANGRKLTVMTFGAAIGKLADVIKTGSDVKLRGRYSVGTKGGVSFVALFVPQPKAAVAA